jgi:Alginate export
LWEAAAFLTRPVEDTSGISGSNPDTTFWGLYITHWFDASHKLGVDLYYLGIANEHARYASGAGDERRHTFGSRIFGVRNQWDWNGEAAIQVGTFGDESILAWTASLDSGYTWNAKWQPRLGLKVDVASGDNNDGHQGTFDALFFKSGYFNDASMMRPANLIDVHPNLAVNLTRTLSVNGGADVFWRYSQDDAIYAPPGYVEIPALKTGSAYVATALDLNLQWQIQKHLTFGASYVHFFTGNYVHAAGGGDVNYVSTTLSFIF